MKAIRRLGRLNKRVGLKNASPRVQLIAVILQIASAAFVGLVILFYLVRAFMAMNVPSDAAGILESAKNPERYVYESEAVRTNTVEGVPTEGHSVRILAVDGSSEQFQARLLRVFPDTQEALLARTPTRTTLRKGLSVPAQIADIPFEAALAPSPSDIRAVAEGVVSEERTVRGVQAWEIKFRLTPEIVRQLFLVDALQISGDEQDAITQGRYTSDWAYVMVTRRERSMVVLDTRFTIDGGATYRFLVKYRSFDAFRLNGEATSDATEYDSSAGEMDAVK